MTEKQLKDYLSGGGDIVELALDGYLDGFECNYDHLTDLIEALANGARTMRFLAARAEAELV